MHGTEALAEADRLMVVCNSCRYCEGLCAVFPAMEMRRAFPDGDLNYLANLCHGCGACYDDCQFSPPHEFDVNVPKVLAQVRADSYKAYAWPSALSGLFDRNGLAIAVDRGAERRGLRDRLRRARRSRGRVRQARRPGRVLCADAAPRDGADLRRRVPLRDRRARHGRRAISGATSASRSRRWPRRARSARRSGTPARCAISTAAATAA